MVFLRFTQTDDMQFVQRNSWAIQIKMWDPRFDSQAVTCQVRT